MPAIVGGVAVDRGLARAAWLGVAVFVLLVGGGAVLLLLDRPIGAVAHTIERIHNLLLRRRPKMTGLGERLTAARDAVRTTLGEQWGQAILRSAGNVLFDYLALLAALVASGSRPTASLVLLAYVASVVLGMIPITPGGLGFVEAGLAAMLVLAGVPGPVRDPGDARLSLGVVLGTDPRRPGRVRAVPTPGVRGGGRRRTPGAIPESGANLAALLLALVALRLVVPGQALGRQLLLVMVFLDACRGLSPAHDPLDHERAGDRDEEPGDPERQCRSSDPGASRRATRRPCRPGRPRTPGSS